MSGTPTAFRTLAVASTPTGSSSRPLTPPLPKPRAGRRASTSITSPGSVFTSVMPSAPASTATRAAAAMSPSAGDSFTNSGLRVAARHPDTTARSDRSSAPNSSPPAFTLGQLTFSSNASSPASPSSAATTIGKSSTSRPTTFTSTRGPRTFAASHGRSSARTRSTPGFARPTALTIPPLHSATRGAGAPERGSTLTALVTSPPSASRSITPASSRPYAAVPDANSTGF